MDNKLMISVLFAAICILIVLIYKHFSAHEEFSAKDKKRLFYLILACGILSGIAVLTEAYISQDHTALFGLTLPVLIVSIAYLSKKSRKVHKKVEQA